MSKLIGYMVTWTTYGSWLQGDKRGYVKSGRILPGSTKIKDANRKLQRNEMVILTPKESQIVRNAILTEAKRIGQTIEAITVCSNHVHLVARPCSQSIEQVVSRYKNVAMFELCTNARTRRIWTRSFDKRFCFTEDELVGRIKYVRNHRD